MAEMQIKSESLPRRCEICHQSDLFNAEENQCARCLQTQDKVPRAASITQRFASKKDAWLVAVVLLSPLLVMLVGCYIAVFVKRGISSGLSTLGVGLLILLLIKIFAYPIDYLIKDQQLIIKSGFFNNGIPLAAITEIFPDENPISSPALSLDRLAVVYQRAGKRRSIWISPQDKQAFMQAIANTDDSFILANNRLSRRKVK